MTPIERLIRAEVASTGPLSVAAYMELCLAHPEHGYYMTRDPLGRDFTTSPEIHQMFGEMLGLWCAGMWIEGARLVELGPGRGTLMADMLRVLARCGIEPEVWLVETSPSLRAEQKKRVPGASWARRLEEVPDGPLIVVANEFFDALPVRQYLETPEGWRERRVGVIDGRLAWGLSGPLPIRPEVEGWCEISTPAEEVAGQIAARLACFGGASLLIDYGYRSSNRPGGPTLQAMRGGALVDPLAAPGEADLTWLVDFDALAKAMPGVQCHHVEQGAFLACMGIGQRAEALATAQTDQAEEIADALERLTGAERMGRLFRVLAAVPKGQPVPAGF